LKVVPLITEKEKGHTYFYKAVIFNCNFAFEMECTASSLNFLIFETVFHKVS